MHAKIKGGSAVAASAIWRNAAQGTMTEPQVTCQAAASSKKARFAPGHIPRSSTCRITAR